MIQSTSRKSDYIKIISLQLPHKQCRTALYAIAARFVHGLACGYIGKDLFLGKCTEVNVGDLCVGKHSVSTDHGHAGHHPVLPAGKGGEHGNGLFFAVGLAQNLILQHHNGVSRHYHIRAFTGDGHGFLPAEPGNFLGRCFGGIGGFVNVCHLHPEGDAKKSQKLLAAGGLGC